MCFMLGNMPTKRKLLLIALLYLNANILYASPKTYTGNQNEFWRVEYEYEQAVKKQDMLDREEMKYLDVQSVITFAKWDAMDAQRDARYALNMLRIEKIRYFKGLHRDSKQSEVLDKKIEAATLNLQATNKAWVYKGMEKKIQEANAKYEKAEQEIKRIVALRG